MSEENWFDIDGDGVVENDEIDKIPLFHKATHRVQSLLREYHLQHGSNSVLYSLTKCDFTSLIKMPEEEQVRLLQKLQARLTPQKRTNARSTGGKKKKNSKDGKVEIKSGNKNNVSKNKPSLKINTNNNNKATNKRGNKRGAAFRNKEMKQAQAPVMSSLFRKASPKSKDKEATNIKNKKNNEDVKKKDYRMKKSTKSLDHLNCAVPGSVRTELSDSGVRLVNKPGDGEMFSKLRNTKRVYNKIWVSLPWYLIFHSNNSQFSKTTDNEYFSPLIFF